MRRVSGAQRWRQYQCVAVVVNVVAGIAYRAMWPMAYALRYALLLAV